MKNLILIILSLCVVTTVSAKARDKDSGASKLDIVSASYGFEQERIIVTDLLRPLIAHGVLLLRAPWGFGNPDPKPGTVKDVVIVYRLKGREETATFHQRQDILLPHPSNDLTIISASYGVPGSRVDATEAVRAAVQHGTIKRPIKWGLGRVDPAAGKIKTVEITYIHEGTLQTASFSQDEELILP
jgi:hypothetical protein